MPAKPAPATDIPRDTRPYVSPEKCAAALAAANDAITATLGKTARVRTPDARQWGELRRLTHTMGAADRAAAILLLVGETAERERADGELGGAA